MKWLVRINSNGDGTIDLIEGWCEFGQPLEIVLDNHTRESPEGGKKLEVIGIIHPNYRHLAEAIIRKENFLLENRAIRKVETVRGRAEFHLSKQKVLSDGQEG